MKSLFAGSLIALGVAAANVSATPAQQVKGLAGGTTLYFSNALLGTLDEGNVRLHDVRPAKLHPSGAHIRLPHGGGVLDLDGVVGEINHAGGLRFAAVNGDSLVLHNLTIEAMGGERVVTAVVEINGEISERMSLFTIDHNPAKVTVQKSEKIKISGLPLLLTDEGEALLNDVLGLELFAGERAAVIGGMVKIIEDNDDSDDDDSDDDDSDDDDSDDDDSDDDDSGDDDSDDDDSDDDDSDDDSDDDDSDDDDSDDDSDDGDSDDDDSDDDSDDDDSDDDDSDDDDSDDDDNSDD